jgi:hypothetical protein
MDFLEYPDIFSEVKGAMVKISHYFFIKDINFY